MPSMAGAGAAGGRGVQNTTAPALWRGWIQQALKKKLPTVINVWKKRTGKHELLKKKRWLGRGSALPDKSDNWIENEGEKEVNEKKRGDGWPRSRHPKTWIPRHGRQDHLNQLEPGHPDSWVLSVIFILEVTTNYWRGFAGTDLSTKNSCSSICSFIPIHSIEFHFLTFPICPHPLFQMSVSYSANSLLSNISHAS